MPLEMQQIGEATLYRANCFDLLPEVGVVDAVIADPPYEKEAHKVGRRTHASIKDGVNADLDFDAITDLDRIRVATLTTEICAGWSIFFCQAEAVGAWRDALEAAGAKYKRPMIWVKPDSSPQFNGQMPAVGYESMPLSWCGRGHPKWNGGGRRGVFVHPCNVGRHGGHPTEKPVPLMSELVSLFTAPGDLVLDCFAGSGTTGVACAKLGRRFIGVEQNARYFDLMCKRIEAAYAQPDMFVAPPPKPVQEVML